MKLVEGSMRRPVTVTMLTVTALLFGFVSLGRLPLNLLPDVSYPTLTVRTEYPDAAPAEVEKLVTEPLEEAVAVVRGLRAVRSTSRAGVSEIILEFGWKTDMDYAGLDVREKIDLVQLPDDVESPVLLRYDPTLDPVFRLGLYGSKDPVTLRHYADRTLKKELESLLGVASVRVHGGLEEEIQVEVDEGKLAVLGIPIETVSRFLQEQNLSAAGGRLRDRDSEFLVRTVNEFESLDDLRQTVLLEEEGRRVLLEDVATIRRGHKEREVVSRVRSQEAVELDLYKEGDANTVQVARTVRHRIEQLQRNLPEGVKLEVLSDQATFIEQSIGEVRSNAVMGGLLSVLVLFLFLKAGKPTLIIGLTIPISILATFFVMQQLGVSLNIMSLGGLALGVGMLVDNAIVVLEAIERHRSRGASLWDATRIGASEVSRAVIASTLTSVAVFLPIIFVEGIAGQIFRDQALTVTASLLVSLIAALTLIPMLSAIGVRRGSRIPGGSSGADLAVSFESRGNATGGSQSAVPAIAATVATSEQNPTSRRRARFAKAGRVLAVTGRVLFIPVLWILRTLSVFVPGGLLFAITRAGRFLGRFGAIVLRPVFAVFDRFWGAVETGYPQLLASSLAHPRRAIGVCLALSLATLALAPRLGSDLVPQVSQGEFTFDLELAPGTTLRQMESQVRNLEEKLVTDDRIRMLYTRVGESPEAASAQQNRRENLAQLNVTIANPGDSEQEAAVIESIRGAAEGAGFRYGFRRPTLFTMKTPVEVHIYGYDLAQLEAYAGVLAERLGQVRGLKDVRSNVEQGSPEVQIAFNRDRMASFDLDVESVANTLRNKIRGSVATRFKERDRQIDILVRTAQAGTIDVDQVENLVVSQVEGVPIPLSSIAEVEIGRGPSEIVHLDQHRAAVVSANLERRDLGSVSREIERVLAETPPPSSLSTAVGGQSEDAAASYRSLVLAIALAAFMVYMVMASEFESFLHPLVIMLTVPLGLIGVVLALAATGTTISVVVLIGVIMLTGIVVNNAIVLIDFIKQRRDAGIPKLEAIIEAGRMRLRPIAMTTGTTVLGLLPMALGLGEGAEIRAPMAIAVIGGLSFATLLTLVLIPVVYAAVDRKP